MVGIDEKDKKYIITFKRKDQRQNKRDDKFEIFRHVVGLEDVRDVLDLSRYKENHMKDPIRKTEVTVTDINSYETPFIMARLTPDQVNRLRKDPNVELVEEDIPRHLFAEFQGWQIPKLTANQSWATPLSARGAGVNVAIIDTGVNPHLDFGPNVKINQNFTSRSGTSAEDPNHHGTHVAGICGAVEGNNEGIQGVAPSCNIWNLRAGDHLGSFSLTDELEALEYANQNNSHVINMSFGVVNLASMAEENLLKALFNRGVVLVAAAGNNNEPREVPDGWVFPAFYTGVNGISNLAQNNQLSPSSNYGLQVDFTAPGDEIESLAENNLYKTLGGTSMSSPAVAGVCALMLSAYSENSCPPYIPGATKAQIIFKVLRDTATKSGLGNAGPIGQPDVRYGFGLPRAANAVASLKGVLPSALVS